MSLVQVDTGVSLQRELEAAIEGEVRFDTVSRALYSTDASVYQIQPLGVVIPKHREDILRTLEICRAHAVPSRCAAEARRRPGKPSAKASRSIRRNTSTACWKSMRKSGGCGSSRALCSMN